MTGDIFGQAANGIVDTNILGSDPSKGEIRERLRQIQESEDLTPEDMGARIAGAYRVVKGNDEAAERVEAVLADEYDDYGD